MPNPKTKQPPRPQQSGSGPSKYGKIELAKLQKEIEGLKLQNGLLREKFDFKRVRESFKFTEDDLQEMLLKQNIKLQQRMQELESASNNTDKASNIENESDSHTVAEKTNKTLEGTTDKMKDDKLFAKPEKENIDLKVQMKIAEVKITKLEKENQGLRVQIQMVRKSFNFEEVQESVNTSAEYLHVILADENRKLQKKVKDLESALSKTKEASNILSENDSQKVAEKTNNTLEDTTDTMDSLISDLKEKDGKIVKLSKKLSDNERKMEKVINVSADKHSSSSTKYKTELEMARNEIEVLKTSKGAQITDGNPDIADLSDLNRPTKLAEKYAELYDNEWMDAFEEIEGNGTKEVEVIKRLLETLKDVYKFCQNVSEEYEKSIKTSALVFPGADKDKGRPKTPHLTATSRKQIVELRKTFAPSLTEDAFKQYIKLSKQPLDKSPKTKLFVKTCVETCWLMTIQDPPVVLDIGDPKGPFDVDKYSTYTKSGKSYEYIVWPPIRLHDAGPLLGKGVAQAK